MRISLTQHGPCFALRDLFGTNLDSALALAQSAQRGGVSPMDGASNPSLTHGANSPAIVCVEAMKTPHGKAGVFLHLKLA